MSNQEHVQRWLAACESPMERLFAEALLRADVDLRIVLPDGSWRDMPEMGRVLLVAQVQYDAAPYRLDFLLTMHGGERTASLVVEIDGHDFHERTKEQARRDRSRDRALTSAGATIFRFTGSEVHRDAASCVSEALGVLRAELARAR